MGVLLQNQEETQDFNMWKEERWHVLLIVIAAVASGSFGSLCVLAVFRYRRLANQGTARGAAVQHTGEQASAENVATCVDGAELGEEVMEAQSKQERDSMASIL